MSLFVYVWILINRVWRYSMVFIIYQPCPKRTNYPTNHKNINTYSSQTTTVEVGTHHRLLIINPINFSLNHNIINPPHRPLTTNQNNQITTQNNNSPVAHPNTKAASHQVTIIITTKNIQSAEFANKTSTSNPITTTKISKKYHTTNCSNKMEKQLNK